MSIDRRATLEYLRQRPEVEVLVIGGGINGVGVWRDLALQGVKALLIERGDFCGGASAASSHMVHGGIRYLENGEFRLVREAVRERDRLLRLAPEHVKPLPTALPIFKIFSGTLNAPLRFLGLRGFPAERGALVIKAGLMLYDAFLGPGRATPRHRFLGRQAALEAYPELNPAVRFVAEYYDAFMLSPERLCWDVVRDGLTAGGRAQNYLEVTATAGDWIRLEDRESDEVFHVRPRVVINAAGPWVDQVNARLGLETAWIGGTKGSHLVLNHAELLAALAGREFFFENADGRIVLICPLGERVLVGTSDLRIDDPDMARCTEDETDYFLEMVTRVFLGLQVGHRHIVFRFSGVRPLPRSRDARTGQISRDHRIELDEGRAWPVLSLVGGKWTTFRAFSEQAADAVLARLGKARQVSTAARQIPASRPELLGAAGELGQAVVQDICRAEAVVHLEDLVLRRTMLGVLGELDAARVGELAAWAGAVLGWDAERQAAEVARLLVVLAERHGVML